LGGFQWRFAAAAEVLWPALPKSSPATWRTYLGFDHYRVPTGRGATRCGIAQTPLKIPSMACRSPATNSSRHHLASRRHSMVTSSVAQRFARPMALSMQPTKNAITK